MAIKPADKIVICTNPIESKSKGNLILATDGESKKPEIGVIYAIGGGKQPTTMKEGDTVAFRKYTENRISIKGEEYNFVRFEDILGVIEN